jgi:hypothetical protein
MDSRKAETVFKEKTLCMGPYAGDDYNSSFLIVTFVVSYPPLLQRERGGVGKISLYLPASFQNNNMGKKGDGGGEG